MLHSILNMAGSLQLLPNTQMLYQLGSLASAFGSAHPIQTQHIAHHQDVVFKSKLQVHSMSLVDSSMLEPLMIIHMLLCSRSFVSTTAQQTSIRLLPGHLTTEAKQHAVLDGL